MLLIPKHVAKQQVHEEGLGLLDVFNKEMENIINENKDKDSFYVISSLVFPDNGNVGKVLLEACTEKPPVIKDTFVYQVDNRNGTKELLWICDKNNLRVIPTNKVINVSPT